MPPIITLLTDFGTSDTYVAQMKGVILGISPDATIIDITHDVQPQAIEQGAFLLESAYRYFPSGTVHVAVVDPGVGTERRALAVRTNRWMFVAPDNGLLTSVLRNEEQFEAYEITNSRFMLPQISSTFHGRDIFSPAAAYLSLGTPVSELGPQVFDPVMLPPPPVPSDNTFEGRIIHIDRFGNCITDIEESRFRNWLGSRTAVITVSGQLIHGPIRTYAEAAPGGLSALFGSSGRLEIAINMGNAAVELGLMLGSKVLVRVITG